jgi:hypothetical protein
VNLAAGKNEYLYTKNASMIKRLDIAWINHVAEDKPFVSMKNEDTCAKKDAPEQECVRGDAMYK